MSDEHEKVADDQSAAAETEGDSQKVGASIQRSVSQGVYASCYYLAYAVVFPTMFLVSFVPMDNAFGHGLIDGAAAARDSVNQLQQRRAGIRAARQEVNRQMAQLGETAAPSAEAAPA